MLNQVLVILIVADRAGVVQAHPAGPEYMKQQAGTGLERSARSSSLLHWSPILSLQSSGISDEGLRVLEHMAQMETLTLNRCRISGEGLKALESCPNLRELHLANIPTLDDEGLMHLAGWNSELRLRLTALRADGRQSGPPETKSG